MWPEAQMLPLLMLDASRLLLDAFQLQLNVSQLMLDASQLLLTVPDASQGLLKPALGLLPLLGRLQAVSNLQYR